MEFSPSEHVRFSQSKRGLTGWALHEFDRFWAGLLFHQWEHRAALQYRPPVSHVRSLARRLLMELSDFIPSSYSKHPCIEYPTYCVLDVGTRVVPPPPSASPRHPHPTTSPDPASACTHHSRLLPPPSLPLVAPVTRPPLLPTPLPPCSWLPPPPLYPPPTRMHWEWPV